MRPRRSRPGAGLIFSACGGGRARLGLDLLAASPDSTILPQKSHTDRMLRFDELHRWARARRLFF
jgi:hypothetical protein